MGVLIKTDLEEMKQTSEKQKSLAEEFKEELASLKESIGNVDGYWNADDGKAYVAKFNNLKNYLDDQDELIKELGAYFNTSEQAYEKTDEAHSDAFSNFCASLQGSI